MPTLRSLIFDHAEPQLVALMALIRRIERFLGPKDDWVEDDRRILYEAAQRYLGDYHKFTHKKGPEDYICTVDISSDKVESILHENDYQRNLLSTRKYREHHNGGRQYAVGSWVIDGIEDDDSEYVQQHHVYLFPSKDGGTDIYGHKETSVVEGAEHITDTNQIHGDPDMTVRNALDRNEIHYYTNDRFE